MIVRSRAKVFAATQAPQLTARDMQAADPIPAADPLRWLIPNRRARTSDEQQSPKSGCSPSQSGLVVDATMPHTENAWS
jgi:hypothetical protein